MEIATFMALYSSSGPSICPPPLPLPLACSTSDIEPNGRFLTSHHPISKASQVSGISALPAPSRHSSSSYSSPSSSDNCFSAARSSPCSQSPAYHWNCGVSIDGSLYTCDSRCSPGDHMVKLTTDQQSPVSVLAGPLSAHACTTISQYSEGAKHRQRVPFMLEQQIGNFVLVSSSTAAGGAHFQECGFRPADDAPADVLLAAVGNAQALTYTESCAPGSVMSMLDVGMLSPHIEKMPGDHLYNAQRNHDVFKDPLVIDAFRKAEQAHKDQFRANGDPYLVHCVETAAILATLGASKVVVAAGLLHDTVDDAGVDYQDLQDIFGTQVADLVEGVTRMSQLSKLARDNDTASKTVEADRLHTMFLAMADVRVVLIKLADRLHNMRTLSALPEYKQRRIAKETLEVFAPLANRLGIWSWKAELEDLCFKHLYSVEHQEMKRKLEGGFRDATILSSIEKVEKYLLEGGLQYHDICGRCKNLYGIFSKMMRKNRSFEEVYDVRGLRLIVGNKQDCYTALEMVHKLWPCVPGKLKDYIAYPRYNGYQSLHTVVLGDDGLPLEVQIRTKEMHYQAEFGVAAHWRYKEDNVEHSDFILEMVEWARWMLTWQSEMVEANVQLVSSKFDLTRAPCTFPHHKEGCPHFSQSLEIPPQRVADPLFVIVLEDDKMMVQELPKGSTVADLLQRRVVEDSFAATCGVAFCEELRPRVNHKVVEDIQQCLRMGDLVEMTPLISDKSLLEFREKFRRMYGEASQSANVVELSGVGTI